MADGVLRRLLLHELHRQHDRLRRAAVPVQRRAAAVGDVLDLPHGHRLGVRDRLAARAAATTARSGRDRDCSASPARWRRLREPFLLIAGYGKTGELLGRAFDGLDRRFVVVDEDARTASTRWTLDPYFADVPGLVADAGNPDHLVAAGLNHACCEGVLALTERRRGQPRGHDVRRRCCARTCASSRARSRPRSRTACGPSARRPSSTRSTASATTSGSRCAGPRRSSSSPGWRAVRARSSRGAATRRRRAAGSSAATAASAAS